jgi:hypothetical protein
MGMRALFARGGREHWNLTGSQTLECAWSQMFVDIA